MTKSYCHYESLNVTRDAPFEVIRAAYRSLSQKHHPDKNIGKQDAAQMMIRLNTAYSVLSDPDQREMYDLQIFHGYTVREAPYDFPEAAAAQPDSAHKKTTNSRFHRLSNYMQGKDRLIVIALLVGMAVVLLSAIMYFIWKENQPALRFDGTTFYATAPAVGAPAAPGMAAADLASHGAASRPAASEQAKPAPAPKAAVAPAASKASEYERLTAMLKSMGFGLHKLDVPTLAPKTAAPRPQGQAVNAKETPPPAQAARTAAPSDTGRVREEADKPAAPEPVRNDARPVATASPAPAPAAASQTIASASQAARTPLLVDGRASCPSPAYPMNAYRNGESGTVLVALQVAGDGRVVDSKIQKSSGSSDLDKVARKALTQCKFRPAGDGPADPVWTTLSFVWTID